MTAAAVRGLNHVSVTVGELDRALAFWHGLLGLTISGLGEVAYPHLDEIVGIAPTRIRWAELDLEGGMLLELFQYLEPDGTRLDQRPWDAGAVHICLEVGGLDQLVTRLQEAGVVTRSKGAVQIPFGDWEGFRSIYAVDPDGVTVELLERPTEVHGE